MESYGPIRIATNVHPWLIRRPVRECVTWALELTKLETSLSILVTLVIALLYIGFVLSVITLFLPLLCLSVRPS